MRSALRKLFEFLGKANSENGEPSNMRVIVMYSAFLFSSGLTFTLVYVTIQHPDLILGMSAVMAGLLTSILGWKAYQKGKENSEKQEGTQ